MDSESSEPEVDTRSTTSYEDFSKLHPDMLLYKAAQARNLPVMREALALGADSNWHCEEEDGKTPLIKAVESVCCRQFLFVKTCNDFWDGLECHRIKMSSVFIIPL